MAFPSVVGDEVWWEENRPDEGGRITLMRRASDGTVTELLPAPWDVGTRVHEYGGRSFLPVARRDDKAIARIGVVFANSADQRLYLLERDAQEPVPLTPEPAGEGSVRYADPALSADGKQVLCVREQLQEETGQEEVRRSLVAVPLSGRAAQEPSALRELASGSDFYASPTPSPGGHHLAYVRWNHPRMPWDGTELRVAELTDSSSSSSGLSGDYTVKGGVDESVISPTWVNDATLYVASDWPGWWNLYQAGLTGPAIALYPAEEEFHTPPGRLGHRSFCVLASGKVITLHGDTDMTPSIYDPETLDLEPVETDFTSWSQLDSDGRTAVAVAASATTGPCLVRLDPVSGKVELLRRAAEELPDSAYLPIPESEELPGRYGAPIQANVYPPTNPEKSATADGPAPYVVWIHGGPVSHATRELDLVKAYFTSRGIGVLDVNHGGSTGFGRSYRKRLHKEWGVVDVEDAAAAAQALVERGVADPERLAIRGPSAGGFTSLLALTKDTFACGVSYFGVTDLLRFTETTHDYESRFLDSLVGVLPGFTERYRELSPVNRADDINVPVLLLQGLADRIVTPDQAVAMATALGSRGVPHALLEFEAEGHGFAGEEARIRSLEAELAFYGHVFGFTPDVAPIELTTEPPEPRERAGAAPDTGAATEAPAEASEEGEDDDLPTAEPLPEVTPESGVSAATGEPVTREAAQPRE